MPHDVAFQVVKPLVGLGSFELALSEALGIFGHVQGILDVVKLCIELPQFVIMFAESDNVSQDAPVIEVSCLSMQLVEQGPRPGEELAEPKGHGLVGAHASWCRGAVDVGDVGFICGAECGSQHGHMSVVKVLDPLGQVVEPIACRDNKAWVSFVIGNIPLRGMVGGVIGLLDPQLDVASKVGHLTFEVLYLVLVLIGVLGILMVPLSAGGQ